MPDRLFVRRSGRGSTRNDYGVQQSRRRPSPRRRDRDRVTDAHAPYVHPVPELRRCTFRSRHLPPPGASDSPRVYPVGGSSSIAIREGRKPAARFTTFPPTRLSPPSGLPIVRGRGDRMSTGGEDFVPVAVNPRRRVLVAPSGETLYISNSRLPHKEGP